MMSTATQQQDRYHALDSLRASMMLLGIVLHAAMNYMSAAIPGYFYHDAETSVAMDMIFYAIHSFRMPLFFILAGFFTAMLVANRGRSSMLGNRFKRIAIPFALFWPLLFSAHMLVFLLGIHYIAYQRLGIDMSLISQYFTPSADDETFNTTHLWFLYYLMQFYLLSIPASWLMQRYSHLAVTIETVFTALIKHPLGILLLTAPIALLGYFQAMGSVEASFSFIPQLAPLLYFGLFFVFGHYLYKQQAIFAQYSEYLSVYAATAVVLLGISLEMSSAYLSGFSEAFLPMVLAKNLLTWVACMAVIGFFIRYFNSPSKLMRYITDCSYWVYILHLIFTMSFAVMMHDWPIHVWAKFALNCLMTTAVCVLTYQLFVRHSFIGQLLNGRRVQRPNKTVKTLAKPQRV